MNNGKKLDETEIQLALADLSRRMTVVEQGVSNFRNFQSRANTFFTNHDAREDEREKVDKRRATIHFALLGGLITIITGCAIALFTWVLQGHHIVTEAAPQARNGATTQLSDTR